MANELRVRSTGVAGTLSGALVSGPTPSFRASSSNNGTNSTSVTIPSGAVIGDMLILIIEEQSATAGSPASISGWNLLVRYEPSNKISIWTRTCATGDPGSTINLVGNVGGASWVSLDVLAYQNAGVPTVKGQNDSAGSSTASLVVTPGNVAPNSLTLYVLASSNGGFPDSLDAGSAVSRLATSADGSHAGLDLFEEGSPSSAPRNQTGSLSEIRANITLEIPTNSPGVSMSSTGLADLPVIGSTNHAAITLYRRDSAGRITQKEIVHVVTHSSAATSASIAQGMEGTTALSTWTTGDQWVHGPTPRDFGPYDVVAASANYTMLPNDSLVLASGTVNVTLPSFVAGGNGAYVGRRYTIKNVGTGTVTVLPPTGTIDGGASFAMTVQYSSIDVVTDGTNWFTV